MAVGGSGVIVLLGLFLYGAIPARLRVGHLRQYLFDGFSGVWNALQLTVYAMVLGWRWASSYR